MSQVQAKAAQIEISGALTRETVEQVRLEVLAATSGRRKKFTLLLRGVESLDSTGVQLLASFLESYPSSRLAEPSEAIRDYWERIGATAHFARGGN